MVRLLEVLTGVDVYDHRNVAPVGRLVFAIVMVSGAQMELLEMVKLTTGLGFMVIVF